MDAISIIIREVADAHEVSVEQLREPTHRRAIARPRQMAMTIARELTDRSLPSLGERFGMHHTSILHGVRTIENARRDDPGLHARMARLTIRCAAAINRHYASCGSARRVPVPDSAGPAIFMTL